MRKTILLSLIISTLTMSAALAQPNFRADCRFHNETSTTGPKFCYASVDYTVTGTVVSGVTYGVGCDNQTLYDDTGNYTAESTLDRIDPPTAAYPGLEIQPSGSLLLAGTYTAVLDSELGRLNGTCYVHALLIGR